MSTAGSAAVFALGVVATLACVPPGSAPPYDAGPPASPEPQQPAFKPSTNVMTTVFEDTFDRPDASEGTWPDFEIDSGDMDRDGALGSGEAGVFLADGAADAGDALAPRLTSRPARDRGNLGPDWLPVRTNAWKIADGKLCGENARNHGIWLNRTLPVNARIEFEAISYSDDGDLKAEVWGDGRSAATSVSYNNATSYLAILGGWKNSLHVLARLNEHGKDRMEIRVDPDSDDPRQRPVVKGQVYQFKIERSDGKTVRWSVDGLEYASWTDTAPLTGQGHDHLGFNEWEVKVCFDNVKVTPL